MSYAGKNLKYLRKLRGWTQEEFANKLKIKRSLVGAYEEERAEPRIEILEEIGSIFKLSLDELLQKLVALGLKEYQRVKPVAAPRLDSKAQTKRVMWERDQRRCTNCGSYFAVQEDHKHPKAWGGQYSLNNMRLLCRSCNQRAAIKHFGAKKMDQHLNS